MLIVCLFFRVDLTLSEERWQGVQQVFRWALSCCPPWISLFFPFFLSLQQKRRCTAVRRSCAHTFQWQTGPHARAADWRYSLKHDQAWSFCMNSSIYLPAIQWEAAKVSVYVHSAAFHLMYGSVFACLLRRCGQRGGKPSELSYYCL